MGVTGTEMQARWMRKQVDDWWPKSAEADRSLGSD